MEVLNNILIEFGMYKKLVGLIQMPLKETYNIVRIGKYQSDRFPIQNVLKQGDALSSFLFKFALEYAIRRVPEKQEGMKLNGILHNLPYADDVDTVGENIVNIKKNIEPSLDASKEVGLEENSEKT
jgi:hypothetical protein